MSVIDNALQACFKESVKILKKWTNASPTSNFVASFCFCEIRKSVFPTAQPYYLRTRKITVNNTGVTFGAGTQYESDWSNNINNGVAIPAEIYAVKFIMGGVIHKLKSLAAPLFGRKEVLA